VPRERELKIPGIFLDIFRQVIVLGPNYSAAAFTFFLCDSTLATLLGLISQCFCDANWRLEAERRKFRRIILYLLVAR